MLHTRVNINSIIYLELTFKKLLKTLFSGERRGEKCVCTVNQITDIQEQP